MTDGERLNAYVAASQCAPGYLDFARVGPLLRPVSEARRAAEHILTERPDRVDDLDPAMSRVCAAAAELLGFDETRVTLVPNTSTALFHAAFALGGGSVLVSPFDFPANTQPWLRAQEHGGAAVRWLVPADGRRTRVTPQLIAGALTPDVRAVAVCAVDFATGDCADLAGIREVIGDRLLIVDAIQAFGVVDLPWAEADVVASGGQKWMRGGWSTGVMACSARALDRLGSGLAGWLGTDGGSDPRAMRILAPVRQTVGRFSITGPDMVAVAGFAAALEFVLRIGVDVINARIGGLTARLRRGLADVGADIVSDADAGRSSGIVSFTGGTITPARIVEALAAAGVTVSQREGAVRVSVHASTIESSVDTLVDVVGRELRQAAA